MSGEERLQTERLVARAREGSPSALRALFVRVYADVQRSARRHLGPALGRFVEPEDLADSALGDALRDLDSFEDRGRGSFRSWLAHVLTNKLRRRARDARKPDRMLRQAIPSSELGSRSQTGAASGETSQASVLARHEDIARVREALAQLPERERAILTLRDVEGLDWADVLARSGETSAPAVRALRTRGMVRLAKQLGEAE